MRFFIFKYDVENIIFSRSTCVPNLNFNKSPIKRNEKTKSTKTFDFFNENWAPPKEKEPPKPKAAKSPKKKVVAKERKTHEQ